MLRDDLSIEDLPEELQLEIEQIQATKPLEIIPTDLRENPLYIR